MNHSTTKNFTNIKEEIAQSSKEKELFSNILGYDDIKAELNLIRSWYLSKEVQANEKITLPKGIIFHGRPGCGKTLFTSEFAKSFNWPIIVIEGYDAQDTITKIHECFKKARNTKEKKAVVIIDEMDLLINDERSIAHALQTEIDGVNKDDKSQIFVIATTNHLYSIPDALQRSGRFDRLIKVGVPNSKDRELIFRKFFEYYQIDGSKIDWIEAMRVIGGVSGASIKAICNDVYLRIGKDISTDELIYSYKRVIENKYLKEEKPARQYQIAVHEAGHILTALKYSKYIFFHHAEFNKDGAVTRTYPQNGLFTNYESNISYVELSLAGIAAEHIIFKHGTIGDENDMVAARTTIYELFERKNYCGMKYFTAPHNGDKKFIWFSEKCLNKKDKMVYKLTKKFYKNAKRYLKKHKEDIIKIAKFLYEHGSISYKDIPSLNLSLYQGKSVSSNTSGVNLALAKESASNSRVNENEDDEDFDY